MWIPLSLHLRQLWDSLLQPRLPGDSPGHSLSQVDSLSSEGQLTVCVISRVSGLSGVRRLFFMYEILNTCSQPWLLAFDLVTSCKDFSLLQRPVDNVEDDQLVAS